MRIELTLDCSDLDLAAAFWGAVLQCSIDHSIDGRYVSLHRAGIVRSLQRVGEPKLVKNRMHLDLLVDDVDRAAIERLEALGATRLTPVVREEFGQRWFVLADPEGNECCVAKDADQ